MAFFVIALLIYFLYGMKSETRLKVVINFTDLGYRYNYLAPCCQWKGLISELHTHSNTGERKVERFLIQELRV